MRTRHLFLLCLVLLPGLTTGCASHHLESPKPGTVQRGIASWYGEPFHGRPTASGEIYDMHGLSAAHKELPLGTRIAVRNLENGRELEVRVNDRGPFIRGRVLDLSFGAAKRLGMVEDGLAKVEIRVLSIGDGKKGPSRFSRYAVQLGAFQDRDNALDLLREIRDQYADAEVFSAKGWHRVRVGNFRDQTSAEELRRSLMDAGYSALVIILD